MHGNDSLYIKICGVTDRAAVDAAAQAGADAVGIMHCTISPRHVDRATAARLVEWIRAASQRCGRHIDAVLVVFGTPPADAVALAAEIGADALQLHGTYTRADFAAARTAADAVHPKLQLWRATSLEHDPDAAAGAFGDDLLLLDAAAPGAGDRWDSTAVHARRRGRFLLAGGLTPDNAAAAAAECGAAGVDVSSGVEVRRGVKDPALIRLFIERVRGAAEKS